MPKVVALYKYPVKGFTPEPARSLTILPDGRVAGDRLFAFRFGDAATAEEQDGLDYWPKALGLSLQDFPALARLHVSFSHSTGRVTVHEGETLLVDALLADAAGRAKFCAAITEFVLASPEGRKLARPGRLPLVLVGDGERSRFQDRPRGYVSLHGEASVAELEGALGTPIDDRRFRSNIVVEGLTAREELAWAGGVRIGDVDFVARGPIVRCLATHANPDSGERDAPVLKTLTGTLGMSEPSLGRLLLPAGLDLFGARPGATDTGFAGGVIRIGDEVTVTG
ncbi:MOSC domain-containing protein [Leucobacter sp. HY1910]